LLAADAVADQYVIVGRISGLYGVRGWCKVYSWTDPRENILTYSPWYLKRNGEWLEYEVAEGRRQGKAVIVHIAGIDDRDIAATLLNTQIAVRREQLPPAAEGEYYWSDLVGLAVRTIAGVELGKVTHLMQTGANDVLVVKGDRERLIPFLQPDVIKRVDLDAGIIEVDWDPEF
jgi:16S rRNA processing protein RimM